MRGSLWFLPLLLLVFSGCDEDGTNASTAICGDGILAAGEQCDDGNTAPGDGCDSSCGNEVTPECGDGIPQTPEQCDDGNTTAGDGCDDSCQIEVPAGCGDGNLVAPEECDDGNTTAGDGCSPLCVVEVAAACGNGTVETGEQCDDGNTAPGDGCDGSCQNEAPVCGNSRVETGEQCDDGNTAPGDGCDGSCQNEGTATCGDGILQSGEDCDDGGLNSDVLPDACRADCSDPSCGDGVADLGSGEACDDGATAPGDGCDGSCQIEAVSTCGDGALDVGEECDDGNTTGGDGCDGACQFELLGATCGDSTIDALEKCDPPEAMPADGDGCNATCNLSGVVTTLNVGTSVGALTSDNTYLWLGIGDCQNQAAGCGIARIDIAACNAAPGTQACQPSFVVGGPGSCSCGSPAPALVDGADGTATFGFLGTMATDGQKIWFNGRNTLREYDIAGDTVTTVAGTEGSCAAVDGTGTGSAYFHDTRGLTYWNGLVYLLDSCENVLRSFDPATGDVVTVAGTRSPDPGVTQQPPYSCTPNFTCGGGTPTEGFGTSAVFGSPRYMGADNAGNLFIIDTNGQAIWRYNTVTTYAEILISGSAPGINSGPYSDGNRALANIGRPRGIISDGTSVYFAEQNYATLRQLELSSVNTTTFAGVMGCAASQVGRNPADGTGADTQQVYCRGGGGPPAGVPLFDPLFGAMTYHFATQSIYMADGQQLRRIE